MPPREGPGFSRTTVHNPDVRGMSEADALATMLSALEDRTAALEEGMLERVEVAVTRALAGRVLTSTEVQWLQLAVEKEAQSVKMRRAIIEKTLTGLVWVVLGWIGLAVLDYLRLRGWKI